MTGQRLIVVVLAAGLLATSLTACMHLPPAVAAEMQPAVPPAVNHYRKPPQPAATPPHAAAAP